jgi:hypothetical protein
MQSTKETQMGLLALFFAPFSGQKNIVFTRNRGETGHVNMQHLL